MVPAYQFDAIPVATTFARAPESQTPAECLEHELASDRSNTVG
jgi:hypothetical protein